MMRSRIPMLQRWASFFHILCRLSCLFQMTRWCAFFEPHKEDESDFEEVIPPPAPAVPSPTDSKTLPSSRAGTPGPSSNNLTSSQRNPSKLVSQKPTNLKIDKTQSRPPSRSGTPSLGTQSRAISPHPTVGTSNMAKPLSRANSPQPLSAGGKSTLSRTASPVQASTKPSTPTSAVGVSSGLKRKHPGGVGGKEKRPNPGNNSTPGSPLPDQGVGLMTEQEVINLLRNRPISTKELLSHFKLRLKEDRNKVMVFKIIKSVAQMSNGLLVLKDGLWTLMIVVRKIFISFWVSGLRRLTKSDNRPTCTQARSLNFDNSCALMCCAKWYTNVGISPIFWSDQNWGKVITYCMIWWPWLDPR